MTPAAAQVHPETAVASLSSLGRSTAAIAERQVRELLSAAAFANELGLRLNTHATVKWALTNVGDDKDGRLLARLREGLSKYLIRADVAFCAVWARERARVDDAEHAHLLFHLPAKLRREAERALRRLLQHHAGEIYDGAVKLTFHTNGDIRYLLKGASPKMREELDIKSEWRISQGAIFGKRCGFTENLGPAARRAYADPQLHPPTPNDPARAEYGGGLSLRARTPLEEGAVIASIKLRMAPAERTLPTNRSDL